MVQNTVRGETSIFFNGGSSHRKCQDSSPIVKAEIGSTVLTVHESKPPFVRRNNRFSFLKWFKRGNRDSTSLRKRRRRVSSNINLEGPNSTFSSTESINTFYSTTTVRSFAFHSSALQKCNHLTFDFPRQLPEVGPFGAGAVKLLKEGNNSNLTNVNYTLPNNFSVKKDITERYSLQPSNSFNSCGNLPVPVDKAKYSPKGKKVHVKGKRRAPNPPDSKSNSPATNPEQATKPRGRRRRPAPPPPEESNLKVESTGIDCEVLEDPNNSTIISNDTLMLRGGVLLPKIEKTSVSGCQAKVSSEKVPADVELSRGKENQVLILTGTLGKAMPRPWYKRSVFENSRDTGTAKRGDVLKNSTSKEKTEESDATTNVTSSFPFEGSLSKLNFFHRTERHSEDRRREAKRKSGISILTNISELDKEAAAIVQEEQIRARASTILQNNKFIGLHGQIGNEELVQNMVVSAMESSPRRGTRALISKFNAISNKTKVNVNTNFFTKNVSMEESNRKFDSNERIREENKSNWPNKFRSIDQNIKDRQSVQFERDITKYFLPEQRSPKLTSLSNPREMNSTKIDHSKSSSDSDISERKQNSSSSQAKRTEKIITADIRPKQNYSDNNQKSYFENVFKGNDNKKGLITEKNESSTLSKKLNMIFDEIDRELLSNNIKTTDNNIKTEMQAGPSNQVTQTSNFPIESEKDEKGKKLADRSIDKTTNKKVESRSINSESKGVLMKGRTSILNTGEDPVTMDLKEMLKEMKHSLPKHSKAKKPIKTDSEEINMNSKPSTSGFCDLSAFSTNLKRVDLEKIEKQKVSLGVQTSGNLRKVNYLSSNLVQNSKKDTILTSAQTKSQNSASKLIKNEFHSVKPKDYVEIEDIKMVKRSSQEKTYANVIDHSLYVNATVPPPNPLSNIEAHQSSVRNETLAETNTNSFSSRLNKKETLILTGNSQPNCFDEFRKQNMNTLAINKSLKKLEAAIASGNHQQAAFLAKELAQLKIHCSVIRQRASDCKAVLNVNMYIEDKEAHQGPIPLLLPTNMTVAQLKAKIYVEFEIPMNIQRWIIRKNLADNDDSTLEGLEITEGSSIFLYLITPDSHQNEVPQPEKSTIVQDTDKSDIQVKHFSSEVTLVTKELDYHEKNLQPETTVVIEESVKAMENLNPLKQDEEKEHLTEELKSVRYEALLSLEKYDVIPNSEPVECPVCFIECGPQKGITLRDCLHTFCRTCLANTIFYCEEAEVMCPYRDSIYTCESTLQEREIKALVEPEVYQQHLAKSIAQAENNAGNNAFHCKTPDCPGWCIYDDNVNNFFCPVCHMNNCLTCQSIHMGKNCRQYQEELKLSKETDQDSKRTAAMLGEMVDRGEALSCPTCAVVLMKKWGCDWLRCSMCKTEICWVTKGPRWGPGGKGDISGGCRCGENGLKCHPRCNYCH